jgi:hypothetical protein
MTVLVLGTLGDATQNRIDLILVVLPKVAKASCHVSLSLSLSRTNVANVNEP